MTNWVLGSIVFFDRLSEIITGTVSCYEVDDINYGWSSNQEHLKPKEATKELDRIMSLEPKDRFSAINSSPIKIGTINTLERNTIKTFTVVTPFRIDNIHNFYEFTNNFLTEYKDKNDENVHRLATYLVKDAKKENGNSDPMIIKFHVSDFYWIKDLIYDIHNLDEKNDWFRAIRTETYIVTDTPAHETDDGPFLARSILT